MIKAVVNVIPMYPMNCFKFPIKTCKELNRMVSNFWWDSTVEGGGTHWKSWEFLTKSKSCGGMGFRDFIAMNDALLAKTAWRVLNHPNELWVKVLKSLYFPTGDFINAKKGHRASWCWSSILVGRHLLKDDLI